VKISAYVGKLLISKELNLPIPAWILPICDKVFTKVADTASWKQNNSEFEDIRAEV